MASLFGWPFLLLRCRLEQYSDCNRNEARRPTVGAADADAVVTRLDESLEARAQWNLDSAADIPAEVIFRAGGTAAVEPDARPIKTCASDRVGRKRHAQGQLIDHVSGERRNVYAATTARAAELIVRCLRAHGDRQQLRLVADYYRDVVASIGSSAQVARRKCDSTRSADLERIVSLTLRGWRGCSEPQDRNHSRNGVFHCCSNFRREYVYPLGATPLPDAGSGRANHCNLVRRSCFLSLG